MLGRPVNVAYNHYTEFGGREKDEEEERERMTKIVSTLELACNHTEEALALNHSCYRGLFSRIFFLDCFDVLERCGGCPF